MTPTLITLTGPSCAGKSTLEALLKKRGFVNVISTTSRPMRSGEVNGETYYFIEYETFRALETVGTFVESIEFDGNRYGMSVAEVERVTATGKPIVVVCEPNGRDQIAAFCDARGWKHLAVFVGNPDAVIARRFVDRLVADILDSTNANSVKDRYAKRLATIFETEWHWSYEAKSQKEEGLNKPYDLIFQKFDEENTQDVVEEIVKATFQTA